MAQIEELVAQIADEHLRKAIAAEVRELKRSKKFGLVFEEHLPETVRLPSLPVNPRELVTRKRERGNPLWRVKSIRRGIATLETAIEVSRDNQDGDARQSGWESRCGVGGVGRA